MTTPLRDLSEIEADAARATPGPWTYGGPYPSGALSITDPDGEPVASVGVAVSLDPTSAQRVADCDANFIAEARSDVPALVARIRELEAPVTVTRQPFKIWRVFSGFTGNGDVHRIAFAPSADAAIAAAVAAGMKCTAAAAPTAEEVAVISWDGVLVETGDRDL